MDDVHEYKSRFQPGDKVVVGDVIEGVVDRVIFSRGRPAPIIMVEWWDSSVVHNREFYEEEVHLQTEDGNG